MSRQGDRVEIRGTVEIVGDRQQGLEALDAINRGWSAKFGTFDTQTTLVEVTSGRADIVIAAGYGDATSTIPAAVDCIGCDTIYLSSGADPQYAVHEFGHVLGLQDRYTEYWILGERVTPPNRGWYGNIMGDMHGVVQQRNIEAILER